jgi:hypothetical protein
VEHANQRRVLGYGEVHAERKGASSRLQSDHENDDAGLSEIPLLAMRDISMKMRKKTLTDETKPTFRLKTQLYVM